MWRSSASPTVLQWMRHVNHGLPIRWDRRLPSGGGPERDHAPVGQRDRSLPHRSNKTPLSRHDPCGGHHQIGRGRIAACGHHLRRLTLSGSQCGWSESRSVRRPLRPFYGTNSNCEGDAKCRYGTRTDRARCSPTMDVLGKCARRVQLRDPQGGGLPHRPRGDRPN